MKKTTKSPHISVVSPVYGCPEALNELCERLHKTLGSITENYEILLVNDASPDNSWEIIKDLAQKDPCVKGVNLSRNFGQHYAITAGLDFAVGDWVVVMDCDLQDVPEEIEKLHAKALTGFDIVVARRAERKDGLVRKGLSKFFSLIFSYFTGTKIDNRIASYGIYSRKVIDGIIQLREQNRSFGLFVLWVGFSRVEIDVRHAARAHGKSSYDFQRMARLAIDSLVAHSDKLLRLTVKLGLTISVVSLLFALWLVISYLVSGTPIVGWTSLIVSVYLTAGLIIGTIGILGLYIGKIFDEVKNRPLYIVASTTFNRSANEK